MTFVFQFNGLIILFLQKPAFHCSSIPKFQSHDQEALDRLRGQRIKFCILFDCFYAVVERVTSPQSISILARARR